MSTGKILIRTGLAERTRSPAKARTAKAVAIKESSSVTRFSRFAHGPSVAHCKIGPGSPRGGEALDSDRGLFQAELTLSQIRLSEPTIKLLEGAQPLGG